MSWNSEFNREALRAAVRDVGFASVEDALSDDLLECLSQEAAMQREKTVLAEGDGAVLYRARIGGLGVQAKNFLTNGDTQELIMQTFGEGLVVSENASCFTYYGPGDHLGAHRDDVESCAATLILYLEADSPDPKNVKTGLQLKVYGRDITEDHVAIANIPTRRGTLLVGYGSQFWHERPRLLGGESVTALTACFAQAL